MLTVVDVPRLSVAAGVAAGVDTADSKQYSVSFVLTL